jgi:membrane protein involved in colicin uptake
MPSKKKNNKKHQAGRIVTIGGIAAIGAIVAFMVFLQIENAKAQGFANAYGAIVTDSRSVTQQYQGEIGKWQKKECTNTTMASKTDEYLPKFQQLVDRANGLQPTEKYKNAQDFLVKSLESERQSYEHFRNYLITGNPAENETSTQLFTQAFQYEEQSFAAFKAATG